MAHETFTTSASPASPETTFDPDGRGPPGGLAAPWRGMVARALALALALSYEAAVAAVDAALTSRTVLTVLVVLGPVGLSAAEAPTPVAAAGAVATLLTLLSGLWNHDFLATEHLIVTFVVGAGSGFAVLAAQVRTAALASRQRLSARAQELAAAQAYLDGVLGALSEAVTVQDDAGRRVYANRAARELLGLGADDLERQATEPAAAALRIEDEQGDPLEPERLPGSRLLRGESGEPVVVRGVRESDGEERWLLVKSSLLTNPRGERLAVNVLEDVTFAKRAELRARFMAKASDVLASSLDYKQTLSNVAGLAVPAVADWCAVDMIDPEGKRVQIAVAHADPSKVALAERLRQIQPWRLDPDQGLGVVLRTGRSQLYEEITDEMLVAAATSDEQLRLLREVGMRSVVIVPLRSGNRVIGAVTLVSSESGRRLGQADVQLAAQLASRAGVAVENARLYTERSEVARTLQRSLLPEALPDIPGWDLAAVYLPAAQGTEVGGDFYDMWPVRDGWLVMIGDVTGKGVHAAAVTSLVRHAAEAASEYEHQPACVLAQVDRMLRRRGGAICTALCLRLDGQGISLASGGHPLPFVVSPEGVREAGRHGPLLGAFEDLSWREDAVALRPGETVVLFTDGVTDTVGPGGERFGPDRLTATLAAAGPGTAAELAGALSGALQGFRVGAQADDTAILALHRLPGDATR